MRYSLLLLASAATTASPALGASSSTSINLVATIPVSCSLDLLDGAIVGRRLTINVRRTCNTGHQVTLSGQSPGALGTLKVRFHDQATELVGSEVEFYQEERFYSGVDQMVIEASEGSSEDLLAYASSLNIGVRV